MLLISVKNSNLLLCRFIWQKSCTNWLTLSVINIDLFLTYVFICLWALKKRGKTTSFQKFIHWNLCKCYFILIPFSVFFFSQDFPETFPWIVSDNIFFVSKFWKFWQVAYASFLVCFNNKTHHRDGQPGSLQTQSLTCKKRDWFPVIIQTQVSL